jgi:hypothetical protein
MKILNDYVNPLIGKTFMDSKNESYKIKELCFFACGGTYKEACLEVVYGSGKECLLSLEDHLKDIEIELSPKKSKLETLQEENALGPVPGEGPAVTGGSEY